MYRLLAGLLVLGLMVSSTGGADKPEDKTKKSDLSVGSKMPELMSQNLAGKKVKLSDLKGKVVMVDVWATWCGYCVQMIPHEREMVKRLKGKPFVLVSVSADAKKETVTNFLKETPMPWTHWWNGPKGGILSTLEIRGYPTIFVIDDKGVIRHKWVRAPENKVLDEAIEKLVKEVDATKKKA